MGTENVIDVFRHMLYVVMAGVAVISLPGLVVGLIIAIFQAATQINEMTLSFLPKLIVMLVVIALLAPWMIHVMTEYTTNLFLDIPYFIG